MTQFSPVSQDQVLEIVKNLKNSKATDLDNIDTNTIKLAIEEILPALTHVVNLSLMNQKFPRVDKRSKIIPLLKGGYTQKRKSYRNIFEQILINHKSRISFIC